MQSLYEKSAIHILYIYSVPNSTNMFERSTFIYTILIRRKKLKISIIDFNLVFWNYVCMWY